MAFIAESPQSVCCSVHLAMSFTAMHWLRQKPCNITTGLHMTQAQDSELAAFAKQAEEVSRGGQW